METLGVFRVFIGGSLRSKPLSVSSALLSVTQCGLIEAEPEKYYKRSKNKMPGSSQKRWKPKSHQGFAEKKYLSWKKIQVCNLSQLIQSASDWRGFVTHIINKMAHCLPYPLLAQLLCLGGLLVADTAITPATGPQEVQKGTVIYWSFSVMVTVSVLLNTLS